MTGKVGIGVLEDSSCVCFQRCRSPIPATKSVLMGSRLFRVDMGIWTDVLSTMWKHVFAIE